MLKKVLVVDDSPLIHQMYRLVLARYKCEILAARNGQEAFDVLARQAGVDLVLLDINMPVMNGVQFLEKCSLLGMTDELMIIVVSTEGKEADTVKALRLGARGYLTKPFSAAQLHDIIGRIIPGSDAVRAVPSP